MVTYNRLFIAQLLAEEGIDFKEEFQKFSDEEQADFIEFFLDVFAWSLRTMNDVPRDIRTSAFVQLFDMIGDDRLRDLGGAILQGHQLRVEEGE